MNGIKNLRLLCTPNLPKTKPGGGVCGLGNGISQDMSMWYIFHIKDDYRGFNFESLCTKFRDREKTRVRIQKLVRENRAADDDPESIG